MNAGVMEPSVWRDVATTEPTVNTPRLECVPRGGDVPEPRFISWRAKDIEPGVCLSNRRADDSGEVHLLEPLKVVEVGEYINPADGDVYVKLTFANGWWMSFEPDFLCEVQCVDLPHPSWCVKDDYDNFDGTVRHTGGEGEITFTDETGRAHDVYVVLSRWDDPDGSIAEAASVSVVANSTDSFDLTAEAARDLGRMILTAGEADDNPYLVDVAHTRLDDEVLTPDGWQTVTCIIQDGQCREVAIYTIDDEDAALRLPLGERVQIRRIQTPEVSR